jgi:hypothetical protein
VAIALRGLAVSFVRPELRAAMWRWREAISGGALFVLGLWAALGPGGLLGGIGWFLAAMGAGLALTGVHRGLFRAPRGQGPGSVDVDEGQVTYFGPLTGGAVALQELTEIALIREGQSPHWRLRAGTATLHIPVDADGADALYDAFTSLPGLQSGMLVAALQARDGLDRIVWARGGPVRLR